MSPIHKPLSRRFFLRGAAGAVLAMPLLESLLPRELRAQSSSAPKRLVVLKSFSTQLIKKWYPSFTGNGYALRDSRYTDSKADGTTLLTQALAGGPHTWAPLRDFETDAGISPILGPSLNPFLDELTLIRGLDFLPSVNHNYGGLLGNFSSCTNATPCEADMLGDIPTIDQVLAYSSKFYPSAPRLRALHICQGVEDSMSYGNGGQAGAPVQQQKARTNPLDVWNDLFAGVVEPAPTGGAPARPSRDALLIDKVRDQYVALRGSSRLSGEDKQKVDQYVTLVSELQARLTTTPMLACTRPAEPGNLDNNQGTDPSDIATRWELYLDLVAAALMCDSTRVVTIGVHKALGPGPDPSDSTLVGHYHSEDASGGTWHGLAHDFGNENSRRMLEGINAWITREVFAKLLGKLDVAEAGGSTLLDNSLVYWGNELGFNHIGYSVPCLLAGSAGGAIQPGRYLDYIDWESHAFFSQEDGNVIRGIPHNRFLVSVLQAMGLSPDDYERDGQPGYGSTTIDRDPTLWATDYDLSQVGNPLPGLSAG